jgi:hypothetical protein
VLVAIGQGLVYVATALCVARGLPVVAEFVYAEREAILGRAAARGPRR